VDIMVGERVVFKVGTWRNLGDGERVDRNNGNRVGISVGLIEDTRVVFVRGGLVPVTRGGLVNDALGDLVPVTRGDLVRGIRGGTD
jgi:hypothetical protein